MTSYSYDALGKKNGVLERGWLWRSQLQPVAELDGTGAVTKRFIYAEGVTSRS